MNALLIFLALLAAGSGTVAVKQHKQLKTANDAAKQEQVQLARITDDLIKTTENFQTASASLQAEDMAIRKENAGWKAACGDQMVFILATGIDLAKPVPDIKAAIRDNADAVKAGEPVTVAQQQAAQALVDAAGAERDKYEAQLLKDAADAKAERDQAVKDAAQAHAAAVSAIQTAGEATADAGVATQQAKDLNAQVIEVTDQKASLAARIAVLTAYCAKYTGLAVILGLLAIGGFWLWHWEHIHHGYTKRAHADTLSKLASEQAAHAATKDAHAVNPPTP